MEEEIKSEKSTRGIKWQWAKLAQARTKEEFQSALLELAEVVGNSDMHVTLVIPPKEYVRLAGNAWVAYKYGELEACNAKSIIDRALGMYDLYLKQKAVERRKRG